jgi:hypothetical protein
VTVEDTRMRTAFDFICLLTFFAWMILLWAVLA